MQTFAIITLKVTRLALVCIAIELVLAVGAILGTIATEDRRNAGFARRALELCFGVRAKAIRI